MEFKNKCLPDLEWQSQVQRTGACVEPLNPAFWQINLLSPTWDQVTQNRNPSLLPR